MRKTFELAPSLAAELDREHLSAPLADAFRNQADHVGATSSVVRLTPRREWLVITPPDAERAYVPYLVLASNTGLDVYVLPSYLELETRWEAQLDAGSATRDLRDALRRLHVELGDETEVARREPAPPWRSLGEVMKGPALVGKKGWTLTDPHTGQTVALWRLADRIVAVWITFSNKSPFLTHHRIYWNGVYGLDWSDPPRTELLIRGYDRVGLTGVQRRKWDYFFPPLTDRITHNLRIARRDVTARAIGQWVAVDRAAAAAAAAIGVAATVLGGMPWLVLALAAAGAVLLMRDSLAHVAFGPPDPAAGPRRFVSERRLSLAGQGGARVHERFLLNHFQPQPGTPPPARRLGRAMLDDVGRLANSASYLAPLLALLVAGAAQYLMHVPLPAGHYVAAVLLVALVGDEAEGWRTLREMKHGRGAAAVPGWVAAIPVAGVLVAARTLFPLAGFGLLAAVRLVRTFALLRFRDDLDTERQFLEWELGRLLAQVPNDVPTDEEIDSWLDADLTELDRRSVDELHLDPECLTPVDGRLLKTLPEDDGGRLALDHGRVPAAVRAAAEEYGAHLGDTAAVLRPGRQWAFANGGAGYTLTRKENALHLYAGEDLNPLALQGVVILSWGMLQPRDAFGKDRLSREHSYRLTSWRVGGDGRLRHAVYYVQFLYFADRMLAASGFFYDFIQGARRGRERASNLEYPYVHVVGVQDIPVKNDELNELLAHSPGTLETTLFQLQVVSGHSIRIALTDEFVLKRVKESFREAARRMGTGEGAERVEGSPASAALPRSFLDAEEEDTDAARSKAVINYVKRQWRERGRDDA